jgi:hypothetical protein
VSYSISISGHGASAESVKKVFTTALEGLAEANAENGGGEPGGTASGSDHTGQSFSFSSVEVLHPAEPSAEGEEGGTE